MHKNSSKIRFVVIRETIARFYNSKQRERRTTKRRTFDLKRKRSRRKGENSLRHCPPSFHRSLFIFFFFLIQAVVCVSVNRARLEQGVGEGQSGFNGGKSILAVGNLLFSRGDRVRIIATTRAIV